MKEIQIIIRPNLYYKTKAALTENRFYAMSTKEVLGRGKRGVHFSSVDDKDAKADVYANSFVAKKMIDMIVPDYAVDQIVKIVLDVNSHSKEGDGKIFIMPVEEVIRIHTKESGEDALL